jgi:hypothetical protein
MGGGRWWLFTRCCRTGWKWGAQKKGSFFTATKKMAETISYARMKCYMCFIDRLYLALLEQGWTLNEMDVIYYLHLLKRKRGDEKVYIDSVL